LDDDSLSGLGIVAVLIALHAILSMAQGALLNMRIGVLRDLAEAGDQRARRVSNLIGSSNLNVTYQFLVLLIRFAIAAVAVLRVSQPMVAEGPSLSAPLVHALVLLVTGSVTLVLGDLVPEAVGTTYSSQLGFVSARLMYWLVLLTTPLVQVILRLSRLLSSLLKSNQMVSTITEEEIMSMIDAGHTGGSIEEEEKDMIYSVLQLDQTHASEVMVPRIDIVAVEINSSLDEAGEKFVSSGFSRIPVYEESIDNIRGLLYAKDLLECWTRDTEKNTTIASLMRPVYFVPETKRADELLKEIQRQKVHLAIVVDEYGGTAGLVTIENIIEEIIGDIQDEYDVHEEAEYEQISADEYYVDASIDLDDFNDLVEVDLPTEDSDTLGGFIYTYFGRVPVVEEVIMTDKLTMTVKSVDGRRIRKVHVIRKRPEEIEGETETEPVDVTQPAESEAGER
jgi:putative hemolysin